MCLLAIFLSTEVYDLTTRSWTSCHRIRSRTSSIETHFTAAVKAKTGCPVGGTTCVARMVSAPKVLVAPVAWQLPHHDDDCLSSHATVSQLATVLQSHRLLSIQFFVSCLLSEELDKSLEMTSECSRRKAVATRL